MGANSVEFKALRIGSINDNFKINLLKWDYKTHVKHNKKARYIKLRLFKTKAEVLLFLARYSYCGTYNSS